MPDHILPDKLPALNRHVCVELGRSSQEGRTLTVSLSSEAPYERIFGTEILGHEAGEIDDTFIRSGHAPVLLGHDPSAIVGVVEGFRIAGKRGEADIRFAKNAKGEEALGLVQDGILRNVSVGYRVNAMRQERAGDKGPTYRVTNWTPLEVSFVAVPADTSVGIGRSEDGATLYPVTVLTQKGGTMPDPNTSPAPAPVPAPAPAPAGVALETKSVAALPAAQPVNETAIRQQVFAEMQASQQRESELKQIAVQFRMPGAVTQKALEGGLSVDAFKSMILDAQHEKAEATKGTTPGDVIAELSDQEQRSFSLVRAARALSERKPGAAGLEFEVSQELAKRMGLEPRGILIPLDMPMTSGPMSRAALDTQTSGAGQELVGTEHLAGSFIDLLRHKMVMTGLGVRTLTGLRGNLEIPKQTGGATAHWIGEDENVQHSVLATGQIGLSPKTVAAKTRMSRRLLLQSTPDVELLARNDLATTLALELDRVVLFGSGAANEPKGVVATDGIGAVEIGQDGGRLAWEHIVAMETQVSVANADVGTLGYVTNARVRGMLKTTERVAGTSGQFIWEQTGTGDATINGYKVCVSNQIPSNGTKGGNSGVLSTMLFGNFNDVLIGNWGVIDLTVDPYNEADKGALVMRIFHDVDVAVRRAESFVVCDDIVTS